MLKFNVVNGHTILFGKVSQIVHSYKGAYRAPVGFAMPWGFLSSKTPVEVSESLHLCADHV